MAGHLPEFAPPVLDVASIRSDEKNDHTAGNPSNRGAHRRSPWAGRRPNEGTDTRAKPSPKQYVALKVRRRCGAA